jgi:hypothetical protein
MPPAWLVFTIVWRKDSEFDAGGRRQDSGRIPDSNPINNCLRPQGGTMNDCVPRGLTSPLYKSEAWRHKRDGTSEQQTRPAARPNHYRESLYHLSGASDPKRLYCGTQAITVSVICPAHRNKRNFSRLTTRYALYVANRLSLDTTEALLVQIARSNNDPPSPTTNDDQVNY